jgi:hypothetical protein
MLLILAVVILLVWFVGLLTSYTLGGMIHILLAVVLVMVVIGLFQRRRLST